MRLRISYIPQVPMEPFYYEVENVDEAGVVAEALEKFSAFEFENRVKPDYSDAMDLEIWDDTDKEWTTWYDDEGLDFDVWRQHHYGV